MFLMSILAVAAQGDLSSYYLVSVVVAPLLPLLVGLVTKLAASPGLKAVLLLALSAVVGVVNQWIEAGPDFILTSDLIVATLVAWVIAVGTHFGLYKPTGIASNLAPNTGIGSERTYR